MRPKLEDCLIYAFKQTGQFTEEELNLMRVRIKTRYISQDALKELCKEFHICWTEIKANVSTIYQRLYFLFNARL